MSHSRGLYAEPEDTLLTSRAADFLASGPADVVDLIGHVCSLPGAPRLVAEHMAQAMFSGRKDFARHADGRWMLVHPATQTYGQFIAAREARSLEQGPVAKSSRRPVAGALDALEGLSYVVVDVETTGGSWFMGDRITEIACVVVRNGEVAEVFETLVNPQRSIPAFVSRLTNITSEMVRHAPTFDKIAPDLVRILEGNVFVAHNATFDWRFVTAELARATGQKLRGRKICTVKLARKVLPQLSRRSLDYVARYYGVEIAKRHRAGGDAVATARCFIRMMSDLTTGGCSTWGELHQLLVRPSISRRKRRSSLAMPASVTHDTTA